MVGIIRTSAILALAFSALALAAEPFTLAVGEPGGPEVTLTFDRTATPERIQLRTERSGVAGSRLAIRVDRSPTFAFEHVFTDEECRFPDGQPSVCQLVLTANEPAFTRIVAGFKAGLVGHVTVTDAGVVKMDQTVSLLGFTRSYGG